MAATPFSRLLMAAGVCLCGVTVALAGPNPPPLTASYHAQAERIISSVLENNDAYHKLEQLCDGVGNRLSGSPSYDRAVEWALKTLQNDGQENVHAEPVLVPYWERGAESLELLAPRAAPLQMLGLGGSVATPPEGLSAPVMVVCTEYELRQRCAEAKGKIVLFNCAMTNAETGYGTAARLRYNAARWAAECGAVACLVRSPTTRSIASPHTGAMGYGDCQVKIPGAAVTLENADMLARLVARGARPVVRLKMSGQDRGWARSANVVAELRGARRPDEIVVIGGHLDSWDVGQGALDDGGGCVAALETLNVLRRLNLRPARTVRVVLWTNEENGLAGANQYAVAHEGEAARTVAAIESDTGVYAPRGYSIECREPAKESRAVQQLRDILTLVEPLGATRINAGYAGADISPLRAAGVPLLGHEVDMTHYFDYHHTNADTLDKVDPQQLSQNVAVMAVVTYVLADMPGRLGE
jgi:carboxypeptidase Q